MNKPTQHVVQSSHRRDRLARKAARKTPRDDATSDAVRIHPNASNVALVSLRSFRSFSSKSSLSGTSEFSSHTRSLRAFKASTPTSSRKCARLLPRAHKRGGRNKPIVVRDSSSGDIHSKGLLKTKRSAGLKKKRSENRLTEVRPCRSGPAETLDELRHLHTRVLQTLVSCDLNVERKKKRKKSTQTKKIPAPSCSSQELSRLFDPPRCISEEISDAALSADVSLNDTGASAIDSAGPSLTAEDTNTVKTKPCKSACSLKENSQIANAMSLGRNATTTTKISMKSKATKESVLLEKSKASDGVSNMEATPSSVQMFTPNNGVTVATDSLLNRKGSTIDSPPSGCQRTQPIATSLCNRVQLDISTADSTDTSIRAEPVMRQKELMKTFVAIQSDIKATQERLSYVNEILQKKRIRHRDRTPASPLTNVSVNTALQQIAASSSILSQSLAISKPGFVNAATGISKLNKPLGINIPGPVLPGCVTSSTEPVLTNAEWTIGRQDITKIEGLLALATQQARNLGLDVILPEIAIVEKQLSYIRGDLAEQEVQRVTTTTCGAPVIPRAWIDESRLEAQAADQLDDVMVDTEEPVFAFDPVATVSKFLDIVTYPLKYVWRIAYRV